MVGIVAYENDVWILDDGLNILCWTLRTYCMFQSTTFFLLVLIVSIVVGVRCGASVIESSTRICQLPGKLG